MLRGLGALERKARASFVRPNRAMPSRLQGAMMMIRWRDCGCGHRNRPGSARHPLRRGRRKPCGAGRALLGTGRRRVCDKSRRGNAGGGVLLGESAPGGVRVLGGEARRRRFRPLGEVHEEDTARRLGAGEGIPSGKAQALLEVTNVVEEGRIENPAAGQRAHEAKLEGR